MFDQTGEKTCFKSQCIVKIGKCFCQIVIVLSIMVNLYWNGFSINLLKDMQTIKKTKKLKAALMCDHHKAQSITHIIGTHHTEENV